MEDPRQSSLEIRESGEKPENVEQQKLNDATFEPRSFVEQTGDYRQAESIQNTLVVLVENAKPVEEAVTASPPHVPGEADRSKVTASPEAGGSGTVDAIPITVPDVRAAADQVSSLPLPLPMEGPKEEDEAGKQASVRGDLEKATAGPGKEKGDEATPINLPDMQKIRGMDPEPIVWPQEAAVARTTAGEEISAMPIPLPGEPETGEAAAGEQFVEAGDVPASEEGTGEGEDWTPSDWYVHIGPDGEPIVVDANGNPVDSAPLVQTVNPDGSPCNPKVYYKGDTSNPVELPYYTGSLDGCSVLIGADGKAIVVDADGKPLVSQPIVQTVNPDGSPCEPKVYYKGSTDAAVEMSYYAASLSGCSVHVGADGKAVVVDANGKPLDVQPIVQTANPDGSPCEPKVYYKGSTNAPVEMSYYAGPLEDCYLHIGADGKAVVVDGNGMPLASQPIVQTANPDGSPCDPKIYYKGADAQPVELPPYSQSLDGCSLYIGTDGKATVMDKYGKPLACQPIIQLVDPVDGSSCPPKVYYKGAAGNPIDLPAYIGPKPKTDTP
jgi:hypothetical protein